MKHPASSPSDKKMKTSANCIGCRNNIYNGNNNIGVTKCWSLDSAKLVTRFRLCSSTPMNIKEAYIKVRVPNCYHESGYVHMKGIPSYAQTAKRRQTEKEWEEEALIVALSSAQLW